VVTHLSNASASSPGMSRRSLLRGTLLGALGAAALPSLAACGSDGGSGGSGSTTLRVWHWYNQQEAQWPGLISEYEKQNPGVKVDLRLFGSPDDYSPAIAAAIAAGDPPEIFAPHFSAIEYGQQGISVDLKDALGADFLSQFFDAENEQFSRDGKQYAFGWMAQTFGIFYNPQLLDRAGVAPPETWDDLIASADALRASGVMPLAMQGSPSYGFTDFTAPLITQATDDPTLVLKLDAQEDGASWDSEPVVQAMQKLKDLTDAGVFADGLLAMEGPMAETAFSSGQAAMLYGGSWVPQDLATDAPDFAYAIAPTPAWAPGAKHWCADQAGAALSIANGDRAEQSVDFIKYLFEPERYAGVMNDSNSMPSTKAAADLINNDAMKTMTSWLLEGLGSPHILYGPGAESGVADAAVSVFEGRATPAEAAAAVQAAVEQAGNRG